jgi:hypothetical protein
VTQDVQASTAMAKAAFNKQKILFTTNWTSVKCYTFSIALHGAETWAFHKVDEK